MRQPFGKSNAGQMKAMATRGSRFVRRNSRVIGRAGLATAGAGALTALATGITMAERKQTRVSRQRDVKAANSYRDLTSRPAQVDGHTPDQYRAMQAGGGLQRDAGGNVKRADRKANPKQLKRLERTGFIRSPGENDTDYHNRARGELSRHGIRNDIKGDAGAEWLRNNRREMDEPMPHAYADDKRYAQPKLARGYETGHSPRGQR
jgi:hypothetical protein